MTLKNPMNRWTRPSSSGGIAHSALGDKNRPVSSISRVGSSSTAKTSVYGPSLPQTGIGHLGADAGQEAMDDRRYGYVRGLIKKKQVKEAEAAEISAKPTAPSSKPAAPSKYKVKSGTGVTFSRSLPRGGFDLAMRHMRSRDYKTTFRNLSQENVQFLGNLIEKHATRRPTGSGWHRKDRMNMMEEVEKARQKGRISWADKKDFRKIIEELE